MLILTRRPEESVLIGDEIEVRVLLVRGDQVRIGITAPRNVKVDREEVRVRKDQQAHQEANAWREE